MIAGELYHGFTDELNADRLRARELMHDYNTCPYGDSDRKQEILDELLASHENTHIEAPFRCDYGYNIELGKNVYMNFNCVILDVCKVTIGDNVMFAPNVQIYTAAHPLDAETRISGLEFGTPISIGDDTWIGGNSVVCPGVNIGKRCVIGAGSVVTKDIPDDSLAVGNPARVIRQIDNSERLRKINACMDPLH